MFKKPDEAGVPAAAQRRHGRDPVLLRLSLSGDRGRRAVQRRRDAEEVKFTRRVGKGAPSRRAHHWTSEVGGHASLCAPYELAAVWRCGVVGGEVVAALSCDRLGGARQDGRAPQARAGTASRLHRGADQPDAASDAARAEGRNWLHAGSRSRIMRSGCSCGARGCGSKKTLFALEQARADIARRRQRWRSWQAHLDPRRLVFIDETWIKTNMAPLRGWGPKGERLRGFVPHGHWRTLTFLGALRCDQLAAPFVVEGSHRSAKRMEFALSLARE